MNPLSALDNPFRQNIVADAWRPAEVDVPEIHREAFETCDRAYELVKSGRMSRSVFLHGPAGSGKTHLLGRLQKHLTQTRDDLLPCIFVSVRLQTSPRMIWRHVRRRFAEDLLRPVADGATQIQHLIAGRLAGMDTKKRSTSNWLQWVRAQPVRKTEKFEHNLDQLARGAGLDHELFQVLKNVLLDRHRNDARNWLMGDNLTESSRKELGLSEQPPGDLDQETLAQEVILNLCRLAGPGRPVVLCFDQIEALQSHPEDRDGLFRFGQVGATLFNSTDNLLLISCIQSALMDNLKSAIRDADYDRITQEAKVLNPLTYDQAVRLAACRLEAEPILKKLRAEHPDSPTWPLETEEIKTLFQSRPCPARKVIAACDTLFEQARGRQVPKIDDQTFIEKEFQRLREAALKQTPPDETDENLTHALPLLAEMIEPTLLPSAASSGVDLLVGRSSRTVGLVLANHRNMTSLAARLRRLEEKPPDLGLSRLVLIRDSRLPIKRTAKVTRERLAGLQAKGLRLVQPSIQVLAALKALRTILSEAKSGDLANAGVSIGPKTVQEWLAANLDESLRVFFEDLVGSTTVASEKDTDLLQDIAEELEEHFILPLADLDRNLGHDSLERIEDAVRRHPDRFGLLAGPPSVLFLYAPPDLSSGD
ncbi:MAG: ATP-binding protein [Thermodesulfobacteriota bacterium]